MPRNNLSIGKTGEDLAVQYLKKKKYEILARNYRQKCGEIDIVATKRDELVFIEVKTRSSTLFGQPEEAVTPRKQQQIVRVAQIYLSSNKAYDRPIRFDVVSVLLIKTGENTITHIKNAFGA